MYHPARQQPVFQSARQQSVFHPARHQQWMHQLNRNGGQTIFQNHEPQQQMGNQGVVLEEYDGSRRQLLFTERPKPPKITK